MSFRKRNVVIGTPNNTSNTHVPRQDKTLPPGVRPSPLDGRLTTSSGTPSLDQLLAGHNGVPLGTSLLIQEAGTTDFGGTLLRYFAAEGLVQGHSVHLLGYGDLWRRELPGLDVGGKSSRTGKKNAGSDDKMKIAWRYETLGNISTRNAPSRDSSSPGSPSNGSEEIQFCHSFDLTKRLENNHIKGQLFATPVGDGRSHTVQSPFKRFLAATSARIQKTDHSTIHRIVIPGLLSPTLYQSAACRPQEVLQFLHDLRALVRRRPTQVAVLITIPVSLFPRASGLMRWMELLSDGVIELVSLQHQSQMALEPGQEEKSQGLLRAHSLPVFHEKGGGLEGSWSREDLSFKLSASSGMIITPYSLPPVGEEEAEAKKERSETEKSKKASLEF